MTFNYEEGKRRALNLIDWLTQQKEPIPYPTAVTAGATAAFITEDAAVQSLVLLRDEEMINITQDLMQKPFIIVGETLGRHLPQTLLNDLAQACAPTESNETSTQQRRGAPTGNTNALKHGRYSQLLRAADADTNPTWTTTSLKTELIKLRSLLTIIENEVELLPELYLKVVNQIRLTAIAQHAINLHPTKTETDHQEEIWKLPATDPPAPDESPKDS